MSNTSTSATSPFDRTNLISTNTSNQQPQKSQAQPQSRVQRKTPHYPHTASSVSPDRPHLNLSASSPVAQTEPAYTRFLSPSPPTRRNPGDYLSLQKTPTIDVSTLDSEAASLFFRSSPKVSPYPYVSSYYSRPVLPPPRPNTLPPPKYNMPTIEEVEAPRVVNKDERVEIQHPSATSAPGQHGHGVEMVLKASQTAEENERSRQEYYMSRQHLQGPSSSTMKAPEEEGGNNTSPPRDQRNAKVTVVSPPEDAPRRGPAGYDASNVPESPYSFPSTYPGYYPPHGYYPSQGATKNPAPPPGGLGEEPVDQYHHHPPPYYYPPPGYGYDRYYHEDGYREAAPSPGKRQRVTDGSEELKNGMGVGEPRDREEGAERFEPPHYRYPPVRPYYERPPSHGYPRYNTAVSESFDSGDRSGESGSKRSPQRRTAPPHPPVAKASSYPPPPPSPPSGRYGATAQGDASAASYPGARRNRTQHPERGGSGYSYDNAAIYGRAPPSHFGGPGETRYFGGPGRYDDLHAGAPPPEGYYREPRGYPPPGFYDGAGYYPRAGTSPPHDDVHPLLRDDRRHTAAGAEEERTASSPSRKKLTSKTSDESVTSGGGSSTKTKPSTAAQAAIAAGMTEPASAKEVDFDINDPPSEPFVPPSMEAICNQSSDINIHDVLCGRGGGTNTQIGNRRFRSLVQEFQPTYLLCRRKEKPLIARTIVLIIRNRGGRFLKKNDDDGAYYEVGDEKAEAKTSQALREGLDVRASRSTMDGKKKPSRIRKKKVASTKSPSRVQAKLEDNSPGAEGSPQRDGPPPHHDAYSPYPPPAYYYGYGGGAHVDPYYPPYGAPNYPVSGAVAYSPSRKRARGPAGGAEGAYEYPHYPPASPYKSYPPYPPEYPPGGPHEPAHEDENPMWEMDFSPPRTMIKKQQDVEAGPAAPGEE